MEEQIIPVDINSPYICIEQLKKDKSYENNLFSLFHLNIRSIQKNYDELTNLLSLIKFKYSCIILSETFLNKNNKNLYDLPGYKSFHLLRERQRGGGLSIFVREGVTVSEIPDLRIVNPTIEALGVTLQIKDTKINVISIYRPPNGSRLEFINTIDMIFNNLNNPTKTIFVGDFNIDLLNNDASLHSKTLKEMMISNGFVSCVSEPTRPSNTHERSGTLIDLLWANVNLKIKSNILITDISDHYGNTASFNIKCIPPASITIKYRLQNDECNRKLLNNIENADFTFIYDRNLDINDKYNKFLKLLNDNYDYSHPIREKKLSEKRIKNPWLSQGILTSIEQRQNFLKIINVIC